MTLCPVCDGEGDVEGVPLDPCWANEPRPVPRQRCETCEGYGWVSTLRRDLLQHDGRWPAAKAEGGGA